MALVEWDPEKNASNLRKHGVSFEEAAALLSGGNLSLDVYDKTHSVGEHRFTAIGRVACGLITVAYTERGDDVLRIISARPVTKNERERYETYEANCKHR